MRLKSYFADTVEAAIGAARQELGPEAMLVNSRRTPSETKNLGAYEVVFASIPDADRLAEPLSPAGPLAFPGEVCRAGGSPPDWNGLVLAQLTSLQNQVREMRRAVWRSGAHAGEAAMPFSMGAEVLALLAEAEVEPELAMKIAASVEERMARDPSVVRPPACGDRLDQVLAAELADRFAVDARLGQPRGARVTALVGPPGCGKTVTLAKLAMACGLANGLRIQLLSLDNCRIAAADQLRTYAAILGVGCQVLETGRPLRDAIQEHERHDLILIDTPGFSSGEMDEAAELASWLAESPEIEVQLVLPASMKSADLTHAVDRFEVFRPRKLLFTKLDETGSFGPIFSEAARTGKPVSFLGGGQRVPDDLEPATPEAIIGRICGHGPDRISAAA